MSTETERQARIRTLRRLLGLQGPDGDWVGDLPAETQERLLARMLNLERRMRPASKTLH